MQDQQRTTVVIHCTAPAKLGDKTPQILRDGTG